MSSVKQNYDQNVLINNAKDNSSRVTGKMSMRCKVRDGESYNHIFLRFRISTI
jgi:hypothetical protein